MSRWRNGVVGRLLMAGVPLAAVVFDWQMARRIKHFDRDQARLRQRYGVTDDTPIRGYDDVTRAAVQAFAAAHPGTRLATTSGSTGTPKELAYTPARLASYKRDSTSIAVRSYARLGLRRPGMFIFASQKDDDSFAAYVLHGRGAIPPWLGGLVEPARYLGHPALAPFIAEHGLTAARLWLLAVCDPGMLYATNPSTLAAFFAEVDHDWAGATAIARRYLASDAAALDVIVDRVGVADVASRLQTLAQATAPVPVWQWLPSLKGWVAWDGGYVAAFLDEVHAHLPPARYTQVPMYAMSTETIETLTVFDDDGTARYLPLGPEVLSEFLPDGSDDVGANLVGPRALQVGRLYTMVVSDPWGLLRYQTDDLFECVGHLQGLPDLRFRRRRGLSWSFTGEKLTGEQLTLAYASLRAQVPALAHGVELVCFPSHPDGERPGYCLVLAPTTPAATVAVAGIDTAAVGAALDAAIAGVNQEFCDKQQSGRLAATTVVTVDHARLAIALDRRTTTAADVAARAWESQFKLAPLMKMSWQTLASRLTPP